MRSGAVDRLAQCEKQLVYSLGRLLEHIRGLVLEAVHQKAVAVIVVVEDAPQVLPGRQAPVPLQLDRNRSSVDGCDPMIFHSGNGILSDCNLKRAGGIDHAVHIVPRLDRFHGGEGEAYVNCDAGHD